MDEQTLRAIIRQETQFRTGLGFDVHQLCEGRRLIVGGVDIPFEKGLLGHSDADVLVHAVMDALLGAAKLDDIGVHFPDTDPQWKDADSLKLAAATAELVTRQGYEIANVDAQVIAQRPKMAPHFQLVAQNIARALQIDESFVSVKATTTEKLGFTGRQEGIAAIASVLLRRKCS